MKRFDFVELGPVPAGEECVQAGISNYEAKARVETQAWLNQLRRTFPGKDFVIKTFHHELGNYFEVVTPYEIDNEEEESIAYEIQDRAPQNWDDEAKSELGKDYFKEKFEAKCSTKRIL